MFSVSLNILISTLDKSVKSSENKLGLNQRVGVQQVGTKFFSESSKILLTSRLFPVQSLNTEHRTQNTEHRTQNTEHRTQNSELRTQNLEYIEEIYLEQGSQQEIFPQGKFLAGFLRLNPFIIN